jgi:proline dehydrogenase
MPSCCERFAARPRLSLEEDDRMASVIRNALFWASKNRWLRERVPRHRFAQRAVRRFMPGEEFGDALAAAESLGRNGVGAVFTRLGENISDEAEAAVVRRHYLEVLGRIQQADVRAEISVKLTQLGLDLSPEHCLENLEKIIEASGEGRTVWIDMESSAYVDRTLDVYRRARAAFPNVGVCLQAYLFRTAADLDSLLPLGPAIRLVKGAYLEPPAVAYPRKQDVDENFFALCCRLLGPEARSAGARVAAATHDLKLIARIQDWVQSSGTSGDNLQFQMLYGIGRAAQVRLAKAGWRTAVLISYGAFWYPWFVRRLAERPANCWFLVRGLAGG